MAESMFSLDGSSQSGDVFSSVTQIPEHTGKPIRAQSQSHSSVQSTGRSKRDKASAYATTPSAYATTPSVDEKGRETLICNFCQNVIRVGGEIASSKKVTSNVCFTISEEEEEEIPLRNVKARIVKEEEGSFTRLLDDINDMIDIDENYLYPREKELLRTAMEALKELCEGLKG